MNTQTHIMEDAAIDADFDTREQSETVSDEIATALAHVANLITDMIGEETTVDGEIVETEYLVPYQTSQFLGSLCWAAKQREDKLLQNLASMAAYGERLSKRAGNEITDRKLQENNHKVRNRRHQLDAVTSLKDACNRVYFEQTGNQWGAYGKSNGKLNQNITAAAAEAQKLAMQFANIDKKENGGPGRSTPSTRRQEEVDLYLRTIDDGDIRGSKVDTTA